MNTSTIESPAEVISQRITNMVLRHPFFSTCILNLDVKEGPVGTACTDGTRLLWDPDFITSLERDEVSGLLAHEIMHCVLLHPFRMDKTYHDPRLANVACDFEINGLLDTYNQEWAKNNGGTVPFPLPKGGLLDHQYDGMAWEQIYEKIKDQAQQQPQGGQGNGQPGNGPPQPGNGPPQPGNGPPQPGDYGKVVAPGELGEGDGEDGEGSGPTQLTEMDWQSIVNKAETISKMMGNMPGAFASLLDKLRRPEIPWNEYLRRYFDSVAQDDYDARRSDRRYLPQDIYLPTLYSECMGEVVIAIDTSGSIYCDHTLFERFMSEVDDVLARLRPAKTTILQCDTRITDVREYRPGDRVPVDFQLKGGGGTDFRPVFRWVEKNNVEPRVLVFFTDGYGTFDSHEPNYPLLWVDYGGPKYPYGDVIRTKP